MDSISNRGTDASRTFERSLAWLCLKAGGMTDTTLEWQRDTALFMLNGAFCQEARADHILSTNGVLCLEGFLLQ